jgi:hypothetical protein
LTSSDVIELLKGYEISTAGMNFPFSSPRGRHRPHLGSWGEGVRLIDSCITQLKAQGPSRTFNASEKEEEEEGLGFRVEG